MKIIATVHNPLPIRLSAYNWIAFYYDEDDPGIGFGETEREAIDALSGLFPPDLVADQCGG